MRTISTIIVAAALGLSTGTAVAAEKLSGPEAAPAEVRETIEREVSGGELSAIERDSTGYWPEIYDAQYTALDGTEWTIRVDPDGYLLATRRSAEAEGPLEPQ